MHAFLHEVAPDLCARHGIRWMPWPERPHMVQLTYPDGAVRHVVKNRLDLNPAGAAELARVKPYSLYYLHEAGLAVPAFDFFFASEWAERHANPRHEAAAKAYAESLGYPLVLKPATQSWGLGVHLVTDTADLERLLPEVTEIDPMFMLQRRVSGTEYRVVVFDGELELIYAKTAPAVVGDGHRSLRSLIADHFAARAAAGAELAIEDEDPRFAHFLRAQGWDMEAVVPAGERVQVGLPAGFHSGGSLAEAREFPEAARQFCRAAARASGLRLVGLDVFLTGDPAEPFWLIEVNAFPGLDGYASIGDAQRRKAEDLVERLILAMGAAD